MAWCGGAATGVRGGGGAAGIENTQITGYGHQTIVSMKAVRYTSGKRPAKDESTPLNPTRRAGTRKMKQKQNLYPRLTKPKTPPIMARNSLVVIMRRELRRHPVRGHVELHYS